MAPHPTATPRPQLHNQQNLLPKQKLIVLTIGLGCILAVTLMDSNGVSTLLPTIAADLHGQQSITWAGSASLIGATVAGVLYGRLSDIFGRTVLFLGALLVFVASELCCGFAVAPAMFYIFRAITGASGGAVGNLVLIVGSDVMPLQQRGQYWGFAGSFMAMGNMAGPFVAVGLSETKASWRGFFWCLAPLGLVCAVVAAFILPSTKPTDSFMRNVCKIDGIGTLLGTAAIILLLVPISGGGAYYAWDSHLVIATFCVGGFSLVAFLVWELKFARLPIVPMHIFASRHVIFLSLQTFAVCWINQVNLYFLPLYFQNLRGWSRIVSAAMLLPIISVQIVASSAAGLWMTKRGAYGSVIRLGSGLLLIGSCLEIILSDGTSVPAIVFILLSIGVGFGAVSQPVILAMLAHTKNSERAVVTSSRLFFRSFGAAVAIAVSSAVLQNRFKSALPRSLKPISLSSYALQGLDPETRTAVTPAYAMALRSVFIANAAMSVVAALCCLGWKDKGYKKQNSQDDSAENDLEHAVYMRDTNEANGPSPAAQSR